MKDPSCLALLVAHLTKMIHDPVVPEFPPELADTEGLPALQEYLTSLRDILDAFGRGDFTMDIRLRGIVAGRLKKLQAGLLHLCWQIQQVAAGDFTQQVEFMGEFASSFNSMVEQLDSALTALRHKEEELTHLTSALQREVKQKAGALDALRQSEARFRYMAEHDPLTGVCNRRSFYDLAVMELQRAYKARKPCTLIIFDIDHFKLFNDTYGHLEGDAALRHVTQTITAGLRDQDILARYGGEEFVLLLPGVDVEGGIRSAERHRRNIMQKPVKTRLESVMVTVSLGLITVPANDTPVRNVAFLEKILNFADEALYVAKNSGRNRLKISGYGCPPPADLCPD